MRLHFQLALLVLHISGCAGVKFTEGDGDEDKGFLYYDAKPYLVIDETDDGEQWRILSLPDPTKPRRVKQIRGLGSSQMGFSTQHGLITQFNATADSQTDELLTAIAALGTADAALDQAEAALITARGEMDESGAGAAAGGGATPQPIKKIESATSTLATITAAMVLPGGGPLSAALTGERAKLLSYEAALNAIETITYDPTDPLSVRILVDKLAEARKKVAPILANIRTVRTVLDGIATHRGTSTSEAAIALNAHAALKSVIKDLSSFAADPEEGPAIYEIHLEDGFIKLKRVEFLL